MGLLIVAVLLWLGLHLAVAGTRLRDRIVAAIGDGPYRGLFSLAAVLVLGLLVWAWHGARGAPLWSVPPWLGWLLVALMLPAFWLLIGSFRPSGATPRGLHRITRHPMLWSFVLWGGVHLIGNADPASLLFFGVFPATALAGMPSVDAKQARRDPQRWQVWAAETSRLPFAAILAGRNRLALAEIGWLVPVAGLLAWALVLWLHPTLFGASPLPG